MNIYPINMRTSAILVGKKCGGHSVHVLEFSTSASFSWQMCSKRQRWFRSRHGSLLLCCWMHK